MPMGGVASTEVPIHEEFPTKTHLHYALSRALSRGYVASTEGQSRPAIPIELVIQIVDLAGILKTNPTPSLTVHSSLPRHVGSLGPLKRKSLLYSRPLTRRLVTHVRQVRVNTVSRDQGWVNDRSAGNWTWFEVGILRPLKKEEDMRQYEPDELELVDQEGVNHSARVQEALAPYYVVKRHPNDPTKRLRWLSHRNQLGSNEPQENEGAFFGPEHELWTHLDEGDVIGVYACAQFAGWRNIVSSTRLLFWERFDPTGLEVTREVKAG